MKKDKNEKHLSPFSKKTAEDITQYKEYEEHTQILQLGEHVSCKIRLQKTIFPDRESETGIDIRKFLDNKYPFRNGKQGILIEKDKWLSFVEKIIAFTVSVYGEQVFYTDEPEPQKVQQIPSVQKVTQKPPAGLPKRNPVDHLF